MIVRVVEPNCDVEYVENELRLDASGRWVLFKCRESIPAGAWAEACGFFSSALAPPPLLKGKPGRRANEILNDHIRRRMTDMSDKKTTAYKIIAKETGLSEEAVRKRVERLRKKSGRAVKKTRRKPVAHTKQEAPKEWVLSNVPARCAGPCGQERSPLHVDTGLCMECHRRLGHS